MRPIRRSDRSAPASRAATRAALAVLVAMTLGGCRILDELRSGDGSPESEPTTVGETGALTPGGPTVVAVASGLQAGPGQVPAGVIAGRLVDAVTGLPVADAGVSLLGRDRRTISDAEGRFRFDGVAPGATVLVFGPVADYVPRSLDLRLAADGIDLGLTPLTPASPPTLILAEYGGVVAGCDRVKVLFATEAVSEPTPVRVTCLADERTFPAPAPAGRLPLAVVDLSPGELLPATAARLTVALPSQPRYAPGVALDLLRLDLERLIWTPTASLTVDADGTTAGGEIAALGTYMVAAPPFGTFVSGAGEGTVVQQFRLSAEPAGLPSDVFPVGTVIVYALFDYAGMANTPVSVRTVGPTGAVAFESVRPYSGSGRDSVPMVPNAGGSWAVGAYDTTLYVGDPATAVHSVAWRLAAGPTPVPPSPTLPAIGRVAGAGWATAVPVPPPSAACLPPPGWYAYVVRAGDTLTGLAWRTGVDAGRLQSANCLRGDVLRAGTVLYLPVPPSRSPAAPVHPPAGVPAPGAGVPAWPTPIVPRPPTVAPPTQVVVPQWPAAPTTWYTPPPPKPTPLPATVAPRPTPPPIPTDVPAPPVVVPQPTAPAPEEPVVVPQSTVETAPKWPTLPPVDPGRGCASGSM